MSSRIISSPFFLLISFVCIILILLGNWQLERLRWKTALIERVQTRVDAKPIPAPIIFNTSEISKEDHEYLRVQIKGYFLHEHETLVHATTEIGAGYWVMTPLVSNTNTVMINRGFVTEELKDVSRRQQGLVFGEQIIIGLLRLTEPEGQLFRKNVASEGRWYSRDIEAIADSVSLKEVVPYFIDAEKTEFSPEIPIPGMTRIHFRNSHLIYALTWYGLAIFLFYLSISALTRKAEDN